MSMLLTACQYKIANGWALLRVFEMLQQAGRASHRKWHLSLGSKVELSSPAIEGLHS